MNVNLKRLDSIATIQSGAGFPKKFQGLEREKYPFYKVSDMNLVGNEVVMDVSINSISEDIRSELRAKLFPNGSVIFPIVGGAVLTNKKRLISKTSCVDNNVMGVIPNVDDIDSSYLFYYMFNLDLYEISNKANPPSITQKTVEGLMIPAPTLKVQKQIVAKLDQAFGAIDTAKVNIEKNLKNAKELFKSKLNEIFSQKGEGWDVIQLDDLCTIQLGKTPHRGTEKFWDKDKKTNNVWLSISDLKHGSIIDNSAEYVSDLGSEISKITPKGTIMLSFKLTIGRVAFAGRNLLTNEAIASLLSLDERIDKRFLFYYFTFFDWNKASRGEEKVKGKTLNKAKLKKLPIIVPTLEEQKQITGLLNNLSKQTQSLESKYQQELNSLEELKKSILQKALEGEL